MKIALFQFCSKLDYKRNLELVNLAAKEASENQAQVLFLAECFLSLSDGKNPTPYLVHEDEEIFQEIRNISRNHQIHLFAGSVAYKSSSGILNRSYCFDQQGNVLGFYDKRKLFSCLFSSKEKQKRVDEKDIFEEGLKESIIECLDLKVGMNICFDLRFAEFAASYRKQKVNTLVYPSAFTRHSGKAHWHILNQARAIENQAFVISCAQVGQHHPEVSTYGHSLVVSPWGEVLIDAKEDEGVFYCDLDLSEVERIRAKIHMS